MPSEQRYSIGEVAERTGVAPVTLRAWQRRYGLLKPARSARGYRTYSESDLARIDLILQWLEKGVSIGQVKPLLSQSPVESGASGNNDELDRLEHAVTRLDAAALQRSLKALLQAYPGPRCREAVIKPLEHRLAERPEPSAGILRAFWRNALAQRIAAVLANQGPAKRRHYLLSFEPLDAVVDLALAHLSPGVQVVLVADLSPPWSLPAELLNTEHELTLVGEHRLETSQRQALARWQALRPVDLAGSIAAIHDADAHSGEVAHG